MVASSGSEQILAVRPVESMRSERIAQLHVAGSTAVKYTFFGMNFEVFALERLQSIWEHKVGWNLAESGVHPLRVEELIEREGDRQALMSLPALDIRRRTVRPSCARRSRRCIRAQRRRTCR